MNAKNLEKNALFFVREIDGIEESLNTNLTLAKKFIDIGKDNKIDEPARSLLNDLKYKKIPSKLPNTNIFKFNVKIIKIIRKNYKYNQLFLTNQFRPNGTMKMELV